MHKYATIILHYYCDQPSSFSQAPSACGVQCSTERLVCCCCLFVVVVCLLLLFFCFFLFGGGGGGGEGGYQ